MSFRPGKDTNGIASLRRTMQYGWWGENAALQFAQPPTLLSGEFVTQINPTNTGVVNLIGSDANGFTVTPLQNSITLSAAQIIAMNGTPVTLIPAPGAGFAIAVDSVVIEVNRTATAFTGGGPVNIVYHGSATAIVAPMLAANVTTGGAGQVILSLANNLTNGATVLANTAVDITNGTAAFAAGTGTAKVFLKYSIVTL